MKLIVLGNCQVIGLEQFFKAAFPEEQVSAHEVWNKTQREILGLAEEVAENDVVIAQPLYNPNYASLQNAILSRSRKLKTVLIHNIYWDVNAPDSRYVGKAIKYPSAVMNYHSGKILERFLAGDPVEKAIETFGQFTEEEARAAWSRNYAEFQAREKAVDIGFSEELVDMVRREHCFHTFNHPTILMLRKYAEKIVDNIAPGQVIPEGDYPDRLKELGAFIAYKSISQHLGLPYFTSEFQLRTPEGLKPMSPETFVQNSYKRYAALPSDDLQ